MIKHILQKRKFRPTINEDHLVLHEKPNLEVCEKIWKHELLTPDHSQKLLHYCDDAMNDPNGLVKVEYKRDDYGRFIVKGQSRRLTSTTMWCRVRSRLFNDTEDDIDIINAHPNIARNLNKTYNIGHFPALNNYCENRLDIFSKCIIDQEAIDDYNEENKDMLSKYDLLKKLSTMVLFGAKYDSKRKTCPTWEEEFGLTEEDYELSDVMKSYLDEIQKMLRIFPQREEFKVVVDHLVEKERKKVLKKHPYKQDAPKKFKGECFDEKKFKVSNGKKLSVILQDAETEIILDAMRLAIEKKFLPTCYTYDGFQVIKNDAVEDLICSLNQQHDYIKFMVKPFKEPLKISHLKNELFFDNQRFKMYRDYDSCKRYFERYHFKVNNPFQFYQVGHRYNESKNHANFSKMCKNLTYDKWEDFKKKENLSFFSEWECDEDMRTYDKCGYYPPPLQSPSTIHNLWTGFPIEDIPYNPNISIERILYHVQVMANHNRSMYDWILNWLAHIIQYPSRKSLVCPVFYGEQGTGKSTIAEFALQKIMGLEKMLITSEPSKFAGRFTDLHGKLLIVLNEASGESTFQISEILKDRITANTFPREKKGIDMEADAPVYDNYCFTTNNIGSVKCPRDDRRFMPVEVDGTYKNSKKYFEPLYRDLKNDQVCRAFYEFLKTRDISQVHLSRDRPMTELRADMIGLNLNPYDAFLKKAVENDGMMLYEVGFTQTYDLFREEGIKADRLYKLFTTYWAMEGKRKERMPTSTNFGTNIKRCDGVQKNRCSSSNKYTFHREQVEQYIAKFDNVNVVAPDMYRV